MVAGDSIGSLNLYGRPIGHFDDRCERICTLLATHVSIAVGNATAYWGKAALAENLLVAMDSRASIEQAKGIIMSSVGCSPDEAFEMLRSQSQSENRKLRDIAVEIVARQLRQRT